MESKIEKNTQTQSKKNTVRAGRTILVKMSDNTPVDLSQVHGHETGLTSSTTTKGGNVFLVYDTVKNSQSAYRYFRKEQKQLRVKYVQYKVFFTMTGLTEQSVYGDIKKTHSEQIQQSSGGSVLYYKLYMKENKFVGCGDFVVDTKESFDKLVAPESRAYTLDSLSGSYYRFNNKKQTGGQEGETTD